MSCRIGVLASGRGSNLQSIIDNVESGFIPAEIVVVISDKPRVFALERAQKHGIEGLYVNPKDFGKREDFDARLVEELRARKVDLVLLAGYMRLITPGFVKAFKDRIMNIHPALLPNFPGLHGQRDALDYGVKISGCTVHFVDDDVDHGPIIVQAAVPVLEDDDEASLSKRILGQEHRIYPLAVKWFCEGKLKVRGRRVEVKGETAGILPSAPRG
ncbi:MAG TPA: phosphoribosylglycinamide formyltransferase [Candidatus Altiarchaeales archaeon]|nr:phosphoribosylglycinamide formyltransferase [Candidatus Altiarchaeales archaeon]